MKKLFFVLMITATLLACKNEQKDYAVISGKVTNPNSEKIVVTGPDREVVKEIVIASDGTFNDTIHDASGKYILNDGKEMTTMYLENGYNLKIIIDAKDFNESLTYEGKGAEENNYLAKKQLISEKYMSNQQELYKMEEGDFIQKIEEYQTELKAEADKLKSDFADQEKKENDYERRLLLSQYQGFHGYVTGDQSFRVSEKFPEIYDGIDLSDETQYEKSNLYKQLTMNEFSARVREKMQTEKVDFYDAAIPLLREMKDSQMRNDILRQLMSGIKGDEKVDKPIIEAINDLSTDQKLNKDLENKIATKKAIAKGNDSPGFEYENFNGGTTNLEDLRGKLVYIDVWATWCGPCKAEIPHMKRIEEKYRNKDIAFVSISVDKVKDKDKWRAMVEEKEMKGYQLFSDKDWNSDFVKAYDINGIPRFILLDKEGKIISANAPRPSNPALEELFKENEI